jgi:hypothetical protein
MRAHLGAATRPGQIGIGGPLEEAAWTVLQGGLAVVVSPSLRQSGVLLRKLFPPTAFRRSFRLQH